MKKIKKLNHRIINYFAVYFSNDKITYYLELNSKVQVFKYLKFIYNYCSIYFSNNDVINILRFDYNKLDYVPFVDIQFFELISIKQVSDLF